MFLRIERRVLPGAVGLRAGQPDDLAGGPPRIRPGGLGARKQPGGSPGCSTSPPSVTSRAYPPIRPEYNGIGADSVGDAGAGRRSTSSALG